MSTALFFQPGEGHRPYAKGLGPLNDLWMVGSIQL